MAQLLKSKKTSVQLGSGTFFLVSSRLIVRSLGMVNIAIFARLLSPTDFGTMALAMASFGVIQSLGMINFASVIIREKNPHPTTFDTAFTLNLIRGIIVSGIILVGPR